MSTDAFSREPVPLRITSGCFQGRFKVAFNFFSSKKPGFLTTLACAADIFKRI